MGLRIWYWWRISSLAITLLKEIWEKNQNKKLRKKARKYKINRINKTNKTSSLITKSKTASLLKVHSILT